MAADHDEGPFRTAPFDHRQHVKFAWTVLGERPVDEAAELVAREISRFAAANAPGRYHETLTRFWVRLVAHTRSVDDEPVDFDTHLARFPVLLDRGAPRKHYSAAVLESPRARETFVRPDLLPLP